MRLPNFLVIGAYKAGTTSLYFYLKEHPDVFMSPLKEPRYFAYDATNPKHRESSSFPIKSMEAYRDLFSGVSKQQAVGEASPGYLHSRRAASAIRAQIPDAKLIVSLRNPVDRTASVYTMLSGSGKEKRPLEEALQNDTELVRSSLYYEDIRHYMDLFGKDTLKILLFDDLEADALAVMRDVYGYLKVDAGFRPNVSVRHNPGAKTHSTIMRKVQKIYRGSAHLRRTMRSIVPYSLRRRVAGIGRQEIKTASLISADARARLAAYYRDDILKLQPLIDRDLGVWLGDAPQPQTAPLFDEKLLG